MSCEILMRLVVGSNKEEQGKEEEEEEGEEEVEEEVAHTKRIILVESLTCDTNM